MSSDPDCLWRTFRRLYRDYTGFINGLRVTGHLWQGRYGFVAMNEAHFVTAVRYLALNPVRACSAARAEDLLIAALRMRPDRIILGEIRGREASTFLRAINTGHPGSLSTIHADSPERAIDQLALLVLGSGSDLGWDNAVQYIRRSIDIIVQLERVNGVRQIAAISEV